jgi:hypothetical protein
MTHTAARFGAVIVLATALTAVARTSYAAQKPAPSRQSPAVAEAPAGAPQDRQSAEWTREQLDQLLQTYPPSIGRVLKLDPSLMGNPAYMASYPELTTFFEQHPEVVHNPAYFLEHVFNSDYYDPQRRQREQTLAVLAGIGVFIAFMVLVGVVVWLIRLVVTHRRWNRLSKVQFDTHSKVLDRLTSNEELLAYVQTPAGRRFLESAPIPMEDASRTMGAPFSRILWSIQAGIVLLILGIGLIQVSRQFSDEPGHLFTVGGILTLSLGGGFIVSAIAAYGLSRKLGLLDPPATDHA